MAQSELPDDRSPRARGGRVHTEAQSAHDRVPSLAHQEPARAAQRDPYADRAVPRPAAAADGAHGAPGDRGERGGDGGPAGSRVPDDGVREPKRRRPAVPDGDGEREVVRRVFDEATGDEWRVFERDARRIPGSRGERCLFFDGEGIVRRVWHYPADWQTLPATALLALMDRPPLGDR